MRVPRRHGPKAIGIIAAGAASESGPGAVAVGVRTYQALNLAIPVLCGGLLQRAHDLGAQLEAHHEAPASLRTDLQTILTASQAALQRKNLSYLATDEVAAAAARLSIQCRITNQ